MAGNKDQTYDFICFTDLVYEFDSSEKKKIEQKIKRRLKYHQLGTYDQNRVDYMRALKNELRSAISHSGSSNYFQKSISTFSELADFDVERMTTEYHKKYDQVDRNELLAMINFAIYLYHLR